MDLCTPSKEFTVRETLIHGVWGFLNTKTYTLVILFHMMNAGVSIPVLVWLLDWQLGLTLKLSDVSTGWLIFQRFMSMLTSFIIICMALLPLMLISMAMECQRSTSSFLLSS